MQQAHPDQLVDLLLEGMAVPAPTMFDGRRDIVVKSQCSTHTSKHRIFDVLMSNYGSNCEGLTGIDQVLVHFFAALDPGLKESSGALGQDALS
jgi:hypothetical protein